MMTKNNNNQKRTTLFTAIALLGFFTGFMACNQTEEDVPVAESGEVLKSKSETPVFFIVEEMPEFPGGDEKLKTFLKNNTHYPPVAKEKQLEGIVYVKFIIDKTGKITDIELTKSSGHTILDEEAIRVVKSLPNWEPGKQRGQKVNVNYVLPISFEL